MRFKPSIPRRAKYLPVVLVMLSISLANAKPRTPMPTIPEGELARWRFNSTNEPLAFITENLRFTESWSGTALEMSGQERALFALPMVRFDGTALNLSPASGTLRFWFAPMWTSAGGNGNGPGAPAVLLELGQWSAGGAQSWYSLGFDADGDVLTFTVNTGTERAELLRASLAWDAGQWHQIALTWSSQATALYLDGECVARGNGINLGTLANPNEVFGFCLGTDVTGALHGQGQFEELVSFASVCGDDEIAQDFARTAPLAAMGPVTAGEESEMREAAFMAAATPKPPAPSTRPAGRNALLDLMGDCASELLVQCPTDGISWVTNNDVVMPTNTNPRVILTITNGSPADHYDLFRAFALAGNSITNSHWFWVARGTNGQSFTFTNRPCNAIFYVLACTNDTDGDGLSDAFELLANKTSPHTNHSVNTLFTDLEMVSVQVNDPEQDCGTEQNTQSETTLIAFSNTVVAAWVDSNLGVPGYGYVDISCELFAPWFPTDVPQFTGWAVSHDSGVSFADRGVPPLLSNVWTFVQTNISEPKGYFALTNLGNAGDPVLARDKNSGIIYLAGNPQRPSIYYPDGTNQPGKLWSPVWRSLDNGESFLEPVNAIPNFPALVGAADKPALIVDNEPGDGQGDLYLAVTWLEGNYRIVLCRSEAGGTNWILLQTGFGVQPAERASMAIVPRTEYHQLCLLWVEPNRIQFNSSTNRGTNFSAASTVLTFASTSTSFSLLRSRASSSFDYFRAPIMPTLVANPVTGDLYVVYHDQPTNTVAHPNIYFVQSIDGGVTWSNRIQVNVETNGLATDQWQPVITVKPDGTQLFIGWYDRRSDSTNNSQIEIYGTFAHLPVTNSDSFTSGFLISSMAFPPVFTGTNTAAGTYDPIYPPRVPTTWFPGWFGGIYANHMGDYDSAVCDMNAVYFTWGDNRAFTTGGMHHQADVRISRMPWPY